MTKCQSCSSCGMPLEKKEDFSLGDLTSEFCRYCTDEKGKLLPFAELLKMNADCFRESQGLTEQAAEKMAYDLLKNQPAWKSVEV